MDRRKELHSSIEGGLAASEWFIVLASPVVAARKS
jgi:hypothetical protein